MHCRSCQKDPCACPAPAAGTIKTQALERSLPIELLEVTDRAKPAEGETERPVYRMSITSELPVDRFFGLEVLKHDRASIDLSRAKHGLAVRDGHHGDVIGIADPVFLGDDRRLYADVVFSENPRAQEIERDVKARIRRGVSTRYVPQRARISERGEKGKPDTVEITRWTPVHVAFEPDPADISVGVGRSTSDEQQFVLAIEGLEPVKEDRSMNTCQTCQKLKDTCACPAGFAAAPVAVAPVAADRSAGGSAPVVTAVAPDAENRKRIAEIVRLCQSHGVADRAAEFIEKGMDEGAVSRAILEARTNRPNAQPASEDRAFSPGRLPNLSDKDAKRYSYRTAILAAVGDRKLDGIEKEMHDEIATQMPRGYSERGGVLVPTQFKTDSPQAVLDRAYEMMFGDRALDSRTAGGMAETVIDSYGGLIPLLRNNAVVMQAGAQFLTGLTAPIAFAKQTGAASVFWVGENTGADVAASQPTTGLVTLTPKTMMGLSSFSRQLLTLSSESAEAMVRRDFVEGHALKLDLSCLHGLGASAEPLGIYKTPDVLAKAMGGAGTWANIVDMIAQVADRNALLGSPGWIAQTLLAGRYMTIPTIAGQADWLWKGTVMEGTLAGYPARATSQLSKVMSGSEPAGGSSYGLVFGNWADMIIGTWGAMEVIPDPYTKKGQGLIEIATFQMADMVVRHGESFCKATGATLA